MSSRTDKTKDKGVSSPQAGPVHTELRDIGSTGIESGRDPPLSIPRVVVDPQLREDIEPNMQGPVDVKRFVKSVLGFDASRFQWGDWEFTPSTLLHKQYRASNDEPGRCQPFCDMLDDAFSQWSSCAPVKQSRNKTIYFKPTTRQNISGHSGVTRTNCHNPDIHGEALWGPVGSGWATILFAGELVRTSNLDEEEPNTTGDPEPSRSPASVPSVGDTGTGASGKRKLSISEEANKARKTNPESFPSIHIKELAVGGTESAAPSPPPQGKALRLTSDQVQLAGYANEIFKAAGNRRYVTGIFVNDDEVSLWYYDRIGVVRSRDFNMFKDLELFVLFAVAVSVCDRKHVGYEPLLKPGPATGANDIALSTVENNTLCLDSRHAVDGSGAPVYHDVSFQIIGKPIYVQCGIVGRGTVVHAISPKDDGGLALEAGELVAKLSWPVKTLVAEDALIRDIRSNIDPAWSKHIPDVLCSMTLDGEALDLPRKLMGSWDGQAEDRVLRILIARRAEGLEKVRSLEEFETIFLQAVRCHRVVFVKTNILHRDLSVDNLLFTRDGDNALAVVNDWDLGKVYKPDERPSACLRMGTAHFMALDLLKGDPPRHMYRHDLESFIYILIWCAMHFDLRGNKQSLHPLLKPWTEGTWEDIYDHKVKHFSSLVDVDPLISAVQPAFEPLVQKWILPLCNLLMEVQSQILERENNRVRLKWNMMSETESMPHQMEQDAWNETRRGLMTFETFMKTIGEDPVIPEFAAIPQ
ncbi:hypothetical protein EWM64_g5761 [Hericium alpestre]|uniref:Protein kinase domain-containing protein n=1 Tax=Hericium alpestre TaxID=135208 RepID=A0A4Y9ZVQ2_9AGAM|nr:hypothetical protein EWM64_g5761 [Hericium alpestre]